MFFHMVYKSGQIVLPFCHNSRVWRTDGRTDGQTQFSSLDRVCIPSNAVKIIALLFYSFHFKLKIKNNNQWQEDKEDENATAVSLNYFFFLENCFKLLFAYKANSSNFHCLLNSCYYSHEISVLLYFSISWRKKCAIICFSL